MHDNISNNYIHCYIATSRDRLINGWRFTTEIRGSQFHWWVQACPVAATHSPASCLPLPASDDPFRGGKTFGEGTRLTVRLCAIFCAYLEERQFISLLLLRCRSGTTSCILKGEYRISIFVKGNLARRLGSKKLAVAMNVHSVLRKLAIYILQFIPRYYYYYYYY